MVNSWYRGVDFSGSDRTGSLGLRLNRKVGPIAGEAAAS